MRKELDAHRRVTERFLFPMVERVRPDDGEEIADFPDRHERNAQRLLDRLSSDPSSASPQLLDDIAADVHTSLAEIELQRPPRPAGRPRRRRRRTSSATASPRAGPRHPTRALTRERAVRLAAAMAGQTRSAVEGMSMWRTPRWLTASIDGRLHGRRRADRAALADALGARAG